MCTVSVSGEENYFSESRCGVARVDSYTAPGVATFLDEHPEGGVLTGSLNVTAASDEGGMSRELTLCHFNN